MQRFFVPPQSLSRSPVQIGGETAQQISRVLRMRQGDRICLLDGLGWEYTAELTRFGKDDVTAQIIEKRPGAGEPAVKVTLYLSLLNKADKFEWALQKCTEIGAAAFVPVRAARSISDKPGPARIERWQRIIQEAAEQSDRSLLPALGETLTQTDAFKKGAGRLREGTHTAIISALGAECSIPGALQQQGGELASADIFIGPEGGFTDPEIDAARDAGITPVTLGARTLRAETAAVAALTIVLHVLGEMR